MDNLEPKQIVIQFNECINKRDIEGLSDLMSDDHLFIDSSGQSQQGREAMIAGWRDFFNQFPDYQNHFQSILARGNEVFIAGYSSCTFEALDGPGLWAAKVGDGRVAEWRVYEDTAENREQLGL